MTTDPKAYAGHTPGPWHIESGSPSSVLVGGNDNVVAEIVFSEHVEEGKDQLRANARLIAAAPDLARENARLREANAELRSALAQAVDENGHNLSGPTDWRVAEHGEKPWVCNARAALAGKE